MTWTEEQENKLRELWPDPKMSCSMIANEMGVTRNTVIGKARRLELGPKPSSHPKTNSVKRTGTFKPKRIQKRNFGSVWSGYTGQEQFIPRAADIEPLHLSILEVTDRTCKFGYGDGPFTFCGHPVFESKPYCRAHCALVYVAPKQRSEAQRANDLRMAERARRQTNHNEKTRWMAEEAA